MSLGIPPTCGPCRQRDLEAGAPGAIMWRDRSELTRPAQSWLGQEGSGGLAHSCSPAQIFVLPSFLRGLRGVSLGWAIPKRPLSARCAPAVGWELCVAGTCPPSPMEMASDSLSHTQLAPGRGGHTRPHLSTLPAQAPKSRSPCLRELAGRGNHPQLLPPTGCPPNLFPSRIYGGLAHGRSPAGGEAEDSHDPSHLAWILVQLVCVSPSFQCPEPRFPHLSNGSTLCPAVPWISVASASLHPLLTSCPISTPSARMWGRVGLGRRSSLSSPSSGALLPERRLGEPGAERSPDTRLASPTWCHLTALLPPFTWTDWAPGTIAGSVIPFGSCCLACGSHIPPSLGHLTLGPGSPGEESPDLGRRPSTSPAKAPGGQGAWLGVGRGSWLKAVASASIAWM